MTTRISSGRGASATETVIVSKWGNDQESSLCPSGTLSRAPAAATLTFDPITAFPPPGSPELSTDNLPIVDPVKNTATTFHAPVRDKDMPYSLGPGYAGELKPLAPSAYWGNEQLYPRSLLTGRNQVRRELGARGISRANANASSSRSDATIHGGL
jgi:hypothetical protein